MKDALGNDLHEGDLVMVQLQTPILWGVVTEINEGSIVTIQGSKDGKPHAGMQMSKMTVASNHTLTGPPGQPLAAVLALRNPGGIEAEKVEEKPVSKLAN